MRNLLVSCVIAISLLASAAFAADDNLIANGDLAQHDAVGPTGFQLTGSATYGYLGDQRRDMTSNGVALDSTGRSGAVSCVVKNIDAKSSRWYRFTFRGLPQANFAVGENDLHMTVAFFSDGGKVSYDAKEKRIYDLIKEARKDLNANGTPRQGGAEVWRTYQLDFMLPFPQVDQLQLTVGFGHGQATGRRESAFLVDDLRLVPIPAPVAANPATQPAAIVPQGTLIPLGGRWYYVAKPGETVAPTHFTGDNADRLLFKDNVYFAPFAGNTSAVLKAGYSDADGNVVTQDRLLTDNLVIDFNETTMTLHTKGIPNHPTGRFPEQGFGNPSYIGEQHSTYYIPLVPKENPNHTVTDEHNANHALHMGPIGIAINGVVFFNPFDMGNTDATNMMDRCCGHPNQFYQYHYHKYPICVNSPWADEGKTHSPLLGWAFDGYPVYGPFERENVMAKDLQGANALNAFSMHYDKDRGWHYHVTPGKFPYLIGGFWGVEDSRDARHGPPGGGGGPNGGPNAGGPPDAPGGRGGLGRQGPPR